MIFHQNLHGNMENFYHIIGDEKTKEVALFDPGWEGETIIRFLDTHGYILKGIFLTHFHYDHSGQADFISKKTGAPIYCTNLINEEKRKNKPGYNFILPKEYIIVSPDEVVKIGHMDIQNIHAPGHQDDHILFIVGDTYLITGDTLFIDGIGRLDLPFHAAHKMWETLERIKTLPGSLIVCPGHDYGSVKTRCLGEEKQHNPYFQRGYFEKHATR